MNYKAQMDVFLKSQLEKAKNAPTFLDFRHTHFCAKREGVGQYWPTLNRPAEAQARSTETLQRIEKEICEVSYKVAFASHWRYRSVIHVSKLEKCVDEPNLWDRPRSGGKGRGADFIDARSDEVRRRRGSQTTKLMIQRSWDEGLKGAGLEAIGPLVRGIKRGGGLSGILSSPAAPMT
jgi:hypothetical protein